ncbi:MAG TPA: alpha/beta hydrolase, partial [Bacillota bacterium]|nr:alpha/beta hydrolase [Bacillota bacterium]
ILVGTGARLRVQPDFLNLLANLQEVNLLNMAYYSGTSPSVIMEGEKDFALTPPLVRYGDFLGCDRFDITGKVETINVPAQILVGVHDKLTPVRYSEYLRDHLPQASLEIIPEAGHMVMIEQPFEVNMAIQTFLHTLSGCSMQL